jgi:cytochrome c
MNRKLMILASTLVAFALSTATAEAKKKEFASKKEVIKKVDEAVALIEKEGEEKGFAALRDKTKGFSWKDTYVFVIDFTGQVLVHPAAPAMENKNWMTLKDKKEKTFIAEMISKAQSTKGTGWVQYWWPRPGEKQAAEKNSYIKRVKGKNYFCAAGWYK